MFKRVMLDTDPLPCWVPALVCNHHPQHRLHKYHLPNIRELNSLPDRRQVWLFVFISEFLIKCVSSTFQIPICLQLGKQWYQGYKHNRLETSRQLCVLAQAGRQPTHYETLVFMYFPYYSYLLWNYHGWRSTTHIFLDLLGNCSLVTQMKWLWLPAPVYLHRGRRNFSGVQQPGLGVFKSQATGLPLPCSLNCTTDDLPEDTLLPFWVSFNLARKLLRCRSKSMRP